MAKNCTSNYVDRLLMKLDGALCPIWNSLFFLVEDHPGPEMLLDVLNRLIHETTRLKSLWSFQQGGWTAIKPDINLLRSTFQFDEIPQDKNVRIHQLIKTPIKLDQCLPLHVSVGKTTCNQGTSWLISFQLHHAAGDGRSLIHMVQRYWDLLNQALHQSPQNCSSLTGPQMTDRNILKKIWSYKGVLPYLMKPKYRQLSRRADALNHNASAIGSPALKSCRINLSSQKKYNSSELFYSAIFAALVKSEQAAEDKLIRIRLPVDIRQFLDIPANSVENGCAAVILEFSLKTLRGIYLNQPEQLGAYVKDALSKSLKKQIYLSNAVECIVISRLAKAQTLKKAAKEELLAPKRSSTMVITHFGDLTPYLKPPSSIKVLSIQSHTPVWGSNSLVYEGSLYLTITCFDGIWGDDQMNQFSTDAKDWLQSQYDLPGEIL